MTNFQLKFNSHRGVAPSSLLLTVSESSLPCQYVDGVNIRVYFGNVGPTEVIASFDIVYYVFSELTYLKNKPK